MVHSQLFNYHEEIHHPMELKVAALVWGAAEGLSISHLPWDLNRRRGPKKSWEYRNTQKKQGE